MSNSIITEEDKSDHSSKYRIIGKIASGSFGTVHKAIDIENSEVVAVKIITEDDRYKNRELEIMKLLVHDNIIKLRSFYRTRGADNAGILNIVMDYFPENLDAIIRQMHKK